MNISKKVPFTIHPVIIFSNSPSTQQTSPKQSAGSTREKFDGSSVDAVVLIWFALYLCGVRMRMMALLLSCCLKEASKSRIIN